MGFRTAIFGAVIGGFCGGPLGALIGGSIGAMCFNSPENNADDSADQNGQAGQLRWHMCEQFFQCLGKLAKSDGRVSEVEAAFIKELMKMLELTPEQKRQLGTAFNAGRDSQESFDILLKRLNTTLAVMPDAAALRRNLVETFCALVACDRQISQTEREMLRSAGSILHASEAVEEFFRNSSPQDEYNRNRPANTPDNSLSHCYALLGITADATDQEVKKAYRKKAAEFHPDKVQGAGLSEAFIKFAKEQFQEISNAYETICRHRQIKS